MVLHRHVREIPSLIFFVASFCQGAAKLAGVILGAGAFGPISIAVKKRRQKKATQNVAEMLAAYQQVLAQVDRAIASNDTAPEFN